MRLGIDPTNDYVFRLAFGDPANSDLLIHLLNAILELPSPIVDVEILNPFIEQEFETDKLAILDIKARDSDGRLLNVEMQKSVTPALRERLIYYAACLCSSQLSEGDEYTELRPTIGICLLQSIMFPEVPEGHLKFALSNLPHGIQFSEHFQIHTVELLKYDAGISGGPIDAHLEKWVWLFQRAEELDADRLRSLLPEAPFQKMIGILEMISKTETQRHIYESQQRAARDRAWQMKSALREAILSGLEEGRQEGRQEGREEGLRIGRTGQIRLLERFLNQPHSSDQQLASLTLAELEQRVADLQARLNIQRNS